MKKFLSVILAGTIIAASAVSVSASRYAVVDNIAQQDYEQGTVLSEYGWTSSNNGLSINTESDNSYLSYAGRWKAGRYLIDPVSSGVLQISFDFRRKDASGDGDAHISLIDKNKDLEKESLDILKMYPETQSGSSLKNGLGVAYPWSGNMGSYVLDTWYSYSCDLNIDTKTITSTIINRDTKVQIGKLTQTLEPDSRGWAYWPETVTQFSALRITGAGTIDIDNLKFKKVQEVLKNITSQDYEQGTEASSYGWSNNLDTLKIKSESGNQYLNQDASWKNVGYIFDPISDGLLQISFDFRKNAATEVHISLQDKNKTQEKESLDILKVFPASLNNGLGATYPWSPNMGSYVLKTWYSYNCVVDIDTKTISANVVNRDTGKKIGSYTATLVPNSRAWAYWPETAKEFSRLQIVGGTNGEIDIDNLNFNKLIKEYDRPTLSADSFVITRDSGAVETDWANVLPIGKNITVDFGTIMNSENLGDYIYVTAKDSSEKIAADVTRDGNTCILAAKAPWESGVYTIHVSGSIANASGTVLGDDYTLDFSVIDGTVTGTLSNAKLNDGTVTKLADAPAGSNLVLPVHFENTTGEANTVQLISAYYDESGEMLDLSVEDKNIGADVTTDTEFSYTVKSVDGAKTLKLFTWNNFTDLKPITNAISLD